MRDACPICRGTALSLLHRQEFLLPGDVRTHYTVVACDECGFVFAKDLPTPEEYEVYYRSNLKYTYEGSRDASDALLAMHRPSFELVDEHLARAGRGRDVRILDIGCSTGELLALFKKSGYAHLEGVDPTPECRDIARRIHGVDVKTAVLSELRAGEPYDVVLLANVLEHVPDLSEAVRHVATFVRPGGFLFVQVPCATHFGLDLKEPFLEFSIEHINYFTEVSLANLLRQAGVVPVEIRHDAWPYKGVSYPVMTSLWRHDSNVASGTLERSDVTPVRSYIARSAERLGELVKTIDALVDSGEPLVIWGVGSLTARLLATTRLSHANILGFVDSNSGHHGKQLAGRPIAPPSSLEGGTATVLVSSFVYGEEIRSTLARDMHYQGRVVTI